MAIQIKKLLRKHTAILVILAAFIFLQILISAIFPYLTKWIIDDVLLKQQFDELKRILVGTVLLILLQVPVNIVVSYFCAKWTQLVTLDLRMTLSQGFLNHKENPQKNGLFINTLTNDCELVGNQLLTITLNGMPNVLLIIVYLVILVHLNSFLTGITMLVVPLFLVITYITSKKVFHLTKELQHCRDKLIEFLNSHVRNKLLIDLYGLKKEEQQQFATVATQVKNVNVRTNTILSFLNNLSSLIAVVTPLVTLFVGSLLVIHNQLSLGSLMAFNSYIALLFGPMGKLLTLPPMISQMNASIERIEQANFKEEDVHNGVYEYTDLPDKQQLIVKNLCPYIGQQSLLSHELSFSLTHGELVRLTGPNGVGKSIVLMCLIHYHENFTGQIQLDNHQQVVYVPQENFLFEGTIQDNMIKGLEKYERTLLQDLLNLLKFELPLQQTVTPFTMDLSSGQLQKIKLIRALLSQPDILLIDETLANLDHNVGKNFFRFITKQKLTTIFIYHGEVSDWLDTIPYRTITLTRE
ncbi:ABC transporter transmembrane domain-containing protein [Enterococcus gilvus]|uniref:ABC transporter transmembrane domain-containing protein n=1 Tax=Enterococcus gilvus TaxID=160453 RepID=UPI003ED9E029